MLARLTGKALTGLAILATVTVVASTVLAVTNNGAIALQLVALATLIVPLFAQQANTHAIAKDTNDKASALVNGELTKAVRKIVGGELARYAAAKESAGAAPIYFPIDDPHPPTVAPIEPPTDGHGNPVHR